MKIKLYVFVFFFSFLSFSIFAEELTPAAGWYVRFDAGFSSPRDPDLTIPDGKIPADPFSVRASDWHTFRACALM
jgi:hypothetical protein